jgi:hypothetical protein
MNDNISISTDDIVESMMRKVSRISLFEISYRFYEIIPSSNSSWRVFCFRQFKTPNFIPKCQDKQNLPCLMTGLVYKSTGSWYTVKSEQGIL